MLPVFSLKGTPGEVGFQHGTACRDMIHKNVHFYFRLFKHYAALDRAQAISLAGRFLPVIRDFDAALLEEMRGIAEGAGLEFEEILSINCRTELMYPAKSATGECTSLAVLPEASAGGQVLIGQNWDWKPHLSGSTVFLEIEQERKPNVVTLTEAGIVGKIGLNSAGVAACLNILKSPMGLVGVPIHVLMRGILDCERLGDAVQKIVSRNRGSNNNCLLAHADGAALDFETTPDQWDFIYPEAGVLIHTNHFTSERLKAHDTGVIEYPDTLLRLGRARQKLSKRAGEITVEDIQAVLRDHLNHPDSICRHPDGRDPELEQAQTVASIIMDLTRKEVHVAAGPPCENEYETVRFDALQ